MNDVQLPTRHRLSIALAGSLLLAALILKPYHFQLGLVRWGVIMLAGGLGMGLGWLLSPHGRAARRGILIGLAALASLVVLVNGGPIGWSLTTLLSWAAFVAGLGYWLGATARDLLSYRPTTFGSAEWATLDYLRAHDLVGDGGIRLGVFASDEGPQPVSYKGDRHLLTIAPTRSGKGTTAIIPNLLTYRGSALVIDPKGENALITAQQRAAMGQTIHVVDPWGIASDAYAAAARFNPLDWLVPGDPDMTENAMLLADALVVPDGGGERFWVEEAKALLQGLILYVASDEREAGTRHLGRVRDLLLLDGDDMPALFQRMTESAHHIVASTGARCLQKEEKLLANVVASAQAQTHFLDSSRIRHSLSVSDFTFEDLKTGAATIYLVLPADRLEAFGRWLRLLIQQAITVNARAIEVQPARPILFLLDEMPSLGRLSSVEQAFRLMAGFGMQLWCIAQDASLLKELYKDSWEGFVANSGAISYFGSRDRLTAEYFSALCGVTTVWNLSSAIAHAFGSSGNTSSNSTTNSETRAAAQRKLAYPDELMRLPSDRQLILIENHHPVMGDKVRWFEDDKLRLLGRNLRDNKVTVA